MNAEERAKAETKNWITDVVIGCNFCPFASRALNMDAIHYETSTSPKIEVILQALLGECERLDSNPQIETSLLILLNSNEKFDDYLELVGLAEDLLEAEDYEGVYQVASFHPDYIFAGAPPDDPANFTNRSLYPMLHLLREESIERAIEKFDDPGAIPDTNIAAARKKGYAAMEALRKACQIPDQG